MMKRIGLFITIGSIALLFITFVFFSSSSSPSAKKSLFSFPTPTAVFVFPKAPTITPKPTIQILAVSPEDKTANVPINTTITVTFEKEVPLSTITLVMSPQIAMSATQNGGSITFTPQQNLTPNTQYSFHLVFASKETTQDYRFMTQGDLPNTYDFPHERADEVDRVSNPPVFVARQTPYEAKTFSVTYTFSADGIQFVVTLLGEDKTKAKEDFISWLFSLGLSQAAVTDLPVTFQ